MHQGRQPLRTRSAWFKLGLALIALMAVALLGSQFATPEARSDALADPGDVYDPVLAGEPLPDGYRQVLGRDMIHPVYEPVFVDAGEVDWPDNTDVIGVAGVEEAKAYPVSHLSFREMVIDEIEGDPILVSW